MPRKAPHLMLGRFASAMLFGLAFISVANAEEVAVPQNMPLREPSFLDLFQGLSFKPGMGARVVSLKVTRKSDGYSGILTNDGSFFDPLTLFLDIETGGWLISENVGFSIRSHSQSFSVTRQKIPSSGTSSGYDYVDVGTSARGVYSYIGPTIFVRDTEGGDDSRWGIGYGYWKAWFDGDIVLAPGGMASDGMPHTTISGAINEDIGGNTGPIFFYRAAGERYTFEISVSRATVSNNSYETTLQEMGLSISYLLLL